MEKPKLYCRIVREGDTCRHKCHICQSSLNVEYLLFKSDKCVNKECPNYYGKKN